jgi:hypothetical protein
LAFAIARKAESEMSESKMKSLSRRRALGILGLAAALAYTVPTALMITEAEGRTRRRSKRKRTGRRFFKVRRRTIRVHTRRRFFKRRKRTNRLRIG